VNRPRSGARRDRTADLLLAKQALSQLSYGPYMLAPQEVMPTNLFEQGLKLCQETESPV
jgi:hypothetical protein